MTQTITAEEAAQIFADLKGAVAADGDELTEMIQCLVGRGVVIEIESEDEDPEDMGGWIEVWRTSYLVIGGHRVCEWMENYSGSWAPGGTGWWVDQLHTDITSDVESIIEAAEIHLEFADVPRSVPSDDE